MKKIKLQLTMTAEEAWWLYQLVDMGGEVYPHTAFFNRISGVISRARFRHQTPRPPDQESPETTTNQAASHFARH